MSPGMLEDLKIAKPCPADWSKMTGDERVRFCALCTKHVYDLSAMTRADAEKLIEKTEGKVCVRLYKRADGTVLTSDCPVGMAALKRRVASLAAAGFGLLAITWGLVSRRETPPVTPPEPVSKTQPMMGAPIPPEHLVMGEPVARDVTVTPTPPEKKKE